MFLNYGAGLHGHEFSDRSNNRNDIFTLRKTPLIRSSLVSGNPMVRRNTINERSVTTGLQTVRRTSEQLPRAVETTVHFQESTHDFDSDMTSEGEGPLGNLESCERQRKKNLRRRKRDPQKSSVFHLAHPAPTLSHKQKLLQIRPKILLQLQLISGQSRPKPFIDVLPSNVLIPRLARKFPRLLRGKGELGSNDVIIVRSEDYDDTIDQTIVNSEIGEDGLSNRDLLAVICQMPRIKGASQGVAEIVFSDGSKCIATPLPGGLYEIRSKGEGPHEMIARWWIKRYPKRQSVKSLEFADVNADLKYAFSIINPNCKRHPTMATITHKRLEILDSYTTLSSSSGKYPPTIRIRDGSKDLAEAEDITCSERATCKIDQRMQTLIQVTGIWVSLRQNWCPCFKYNDALAVACSSTHPHPIGRARSSSLTIESGYQKSVVQTLNTPDSLTSNTKTINFGNTIRRVSLRGRSNSKRLSRSEMSDKLERTMSAGTAFVQRATARRATTCATSQTSRGETNECYKTLSQQFAVERCSINTSSQSFTTPSALPIDTSSTTAPEQTLKAHRRVQSAYYPPSLVHSDFANVHQARNSSDIARSPDYPLDIAPRISRWKLITNFFRRLNIGSPRSEHIR